MDYIPAVVGGFLAVYLYTQWKKKRTDENKK